VQIAALAEDELGGSGRARLRIGYFSTAGAQLLPLILKRLAASRPDLDVLAREHRTATLMRLVAAGSVDLAIVSDYPAEVAANGARLHHLFDDPLVLALPAAHRLVPRGSLRLRDLAGEAWIEGDPIETTVLRRAAERSGFEPAIAHRVRDWNGKLAFVAAGLGVAIVPGLARTGTRTDVAYRSLPAELPTRRVSIAARAVGADAADFIAVARAAANELRLAT
jgi:DNA-binding transcriptional LysR family regulator